jgi:hypothetical protein
MRRRTGAAVAAAGVAALARSVTVPSRDRGGSRDATRSPSSRGFAPATAGLGDCGRPRRDCSGFGLSGRLRNGNGSRHRSCTMRDALPARREEGPQRRSCFATRRARWVGRRNVNGCRLPG